MASTTRLQEGLEAMTRRVVDTAGRVGEGFPHYGDAATGEWTTSPGGDWTGGFWNGRGLPPWGDQWGNDPHLAVPHDLSDPRSYTVSA